MSVIAGVIALTGTSIAATKQRQYTGANVKNNSLTGADFRNGSLVQWDFATRSRTWLKGSSIQRGARGPAGTTGIAGARGASGPVGDTGPTGAAGNAGAKGVQGDVAQRQFSYNYRDASGRFFTVTGANLSAIPWMTRTPSISAFGQPEFLTPAPTTVTDLINGQHAGGAIMITRRSDVVVSATVTLAHRGDFKCIDGGGNPQPIVSSEDPSSTSSSCANTLWSISYDESDDSNRHTRAECWIEKTDENGNAPTAMGVRVWASSNSAFELENIPVTAGVTLDPGTYSFRVRCRAADRTNNAAWDDWEFVSGNMAALVAAENLGG